MSALRRGLRHIVPRNFSRSFQPVYTRLPSPSPLIPSNRSDVTEVAIMQIRTLTLAFFMLGMAGAVVAQENGTQPPSAREQLQRVHTPQSIDQELARLTKELEL